VLDYAKLAGTMLRCCGMLLMQLFWAIKIFPGNGSGFFFNLIMCLFVFSLVLSSAKQNTLLFKKPHNFRYYSAVFFIRY